MGLRQSLGLSKPQCGQVGVDHITIASGQEFADLGHPCLVLRPGRHCLDGGSASKYRLRTCAAATCRHDPQGTKLSVRLRDKAISLLHLPHQRPGALLRCAPRRLARRRSAAGRHGSRRPSWRWQGPARPHRCDGCANLRAGRKAG
jgi:hypothetical protein